MSDAAPRAVKGRRSDRIEGLRRRGEFERDALAGKLGRLREDLAERRAHWKTAGLVAGGLAAAWTVGYKLFGKHSLAAKLGRISTAASVLFGLGKAVGKFRRFL
jgi:hypothetical protein